MAKKFQYSSTNFSGAWHGDPSYWVMKDIPEILSPHVVSTGKIKVVDGVCWFDCNTIIKDVPPGWYEASWRWGANTATPPFGKLNLKVKAMGQVVAQQTLTDTSHVIGNKFVEYCIGAFRLTKQSDVQAIMADRSSSCGRYNVYFDCFGLRHANSGRDMELLLLACARSPVLAHKLNFFFCAHITCFLGRKTTYDKPQVRKLVDLPSDHVSSYDGWD